MKKGAPRDLSWRGFSRKEASPCLGALRQVALTEDSRETHWPETQTLTCGEKPCLPFVGIQHLAGRPLAEAAHTRVP